MDIIIGLIYEFKKKTQRNESENQADCRYHYFVAALINENGLQGHMLTSTSVRYKHNESLQKEHFAPQFADGQKCQLKFKNSKFLKIPLIKLTPNELINACLHIKPFGRLTADALSLIESKKTSDQAMTWQDYLLNYQPFEKGAS